LLIRNSKEIKKTFWDKKMREALVVAKFGGTSVRDAEAIKCCVQLVTDSSSVAIVVVSATSQTTNHLEDMAFLAKKGSFKQAYQALDRIRERHLGLAVELEGDEDLRGIIEDLSGEGRMLIEKVRREGLLSPECMDQIYSLGERLSSVLFSFALESHLLEGTYTDKPQVHYWDARHLIKTNSDFGKALPLVEDIEKEVQTSLGPFFRSETRIVIVTQGFIGSDIEGRTTTLGREGSDFSAALLASAVNAKALQIWTDVKGILTADPRLFDGAKTIEEMSYDMATKVARLGAKVLFPETLAPVKEKAIPVFVGHSKFPYSGGTWIKESVDLDSFFSIVVKKDLLLFESRECDLEEEYFINGIRIQKSYQKGKESLWLLEERFAKELETGLVKNSLFFKKVSKFSLISPSLIKKEGTLEALSHMFFKQSLPFFLLGFKDDELTLLVENEYCKRTLKNLHDFLSDSF
jgi:aspartate kinase